MRRLICLLIPCLALGLMAGCTAQNTAVPVNDRWANVEGSQLTAGEAGEQFYFNILVDEGMLEAGTRLKIEVSGNVQTGSLRFELRRPDGVAVWKSGTIGPGDFSITTQYELASGPTGTYRLGIIYSENVSATYNLGWHAITLGPAVLLPPAGMILVALAFVIYAARRQWLGWRYLGMGALFWVLTVILKFTFAIPVNPAFFRLLGVNYEALFSPGNIVAYFYIGALTGIFEVGLAYLILRKSRWGKATWDQALAFGIGFGTVEALLLGLGGLVSGMVGITSPGTLPIPALASLANNATLVIGLAPVIERLFVIFAHILACVLIFYAIAVGQAKWTLLAVLYKTLLDTPAGFASFWGVGTAGKLWTIEATIIVFGLIGLWGIIQISRRYPHSQGSGNSS